MRFSHQCHKSEIEFGMQISSDSNRIMDAKKDHAPQAAWPEKTASDGLGPEASVARRLRGPLNSLLLPGGFNRAILE